MSFWTDNSNNPNTVDPSGRSIYGSQGYAFQRFEPNMEGGRDSVGDEGFTDVGYQVGDLQANPRLAAYLQSRGIMPQYNPQYGFVIPNEANPGQVMTDYVRSIGAGDTPKGGVTGFIDKYALPIMAAAAGYGMAGGFGGAAAEAGAAGAAGGGGGMGLVPPASAAGMGGAGAAGVAGMGPVSYSLAGGSAGGAGLGGTTAMLGNAAAGAGAGINFLTNPSVLGGIISGGAGLLGAGLQANAARDAAQGIADANISSNQLMARINEQNRARQEPFYQAGLSALPSYTQGVMPGGNLVRPFAMSDYQADPGYGFRMSEGLKALDRSAASRGNLLSGSTLKGATRYSQDLASQEYNNAYNRYVGNQATQRNALAGLTGFAPTASSAMQAGDTAYGSNAANLASNTANAMAGAGATRASSYGNALAGIGQNIYNTMNPNPINAMMAAYMQSQMAPKTGVIG